ncbi:flagellar hook-length control protein FliK [Marinobacter lacisalsi]|uniref:Flagellar hook-length control protein FliK n=1 Tax=Marinobacter lacisalsi TaxID=475979 RepID=A0ABV8QLG4_9GAMM
MSGMVLTQLLNPESGIDRPSADKALEGAGQGRPDNGPSRYDEVVRQQEKRLEQRRAQERDVQQKRQEARQQEAHQQKTARQDDKPAKAGLDDRRAEGTTPAANERRTDTDQAAQPREASGRAEEATGTHAARQTEPAKKPDDNADQTAVFELVDAVDTGDEAGIPGMALQGQSPDQKLLAPQGAARSAAQAMASLTGTGQKPGGLPTTGALFAAMLEAGQENGKQGRELTAGLQGSNLQTLTDTTTGKAADTLTAQVASRLSAPEFSQSLNQAASLRGADAQALMRNYSTSVDVPVGADEWGEKVMGKLAWLTASQMSVAEIHITPPDMGPLDVRVQVQNDQAAVTVHATTPAVREQLELHGHRLRDMLSEQGLTLEGFDVSDSPGREASDQQGEGDESASDRSGQSLAGNEADSDAGMPESGELNLSWKGELDLYA